MPVRENFSEVYLNFVKKNSLFHLYHRLVEIAVYFAMNTDLKERLH